MKGRSAPAFLTHSALRVSLALCSADSLRSLLASAWQRGATFLAERTLAALALNSLSTPPHSRAQRPRRTTNSASRTTQSSRKASPHVSAEAAAKLAEEDAIRAEYQVPAPDSLAADDIASERLEEFQAKAEEKRAAARRTAAAAAIASSPPPRTPAAAAATRPAAAGSKRVPVPPVTDPSALTFDHWFVARFEGKYRNSKPIQIDSRKDFINLCAANWLRIGKPKQIDPAKNPDHRWFSRYEPHWNRLVTADPAITTGR